MAALLASLRPAITERIVWPGNIMVDVAAYPVPTSLPPDLVTSVRCIVHVGEGSVGERIVVCRSPDMMHVWPGGRRLPGETYETTARREVYEETGWVIDEADLRVLGFLHFRYVDDQPDDHPYPHPDFLQLVYAARAKGRDGRATEWIDLDGWEQGHDLVPVSDLSRVELSLVQREFIRLLAGMC